MSFSRYKVMSFFSSLAVSIINYGPNLLFVTGLIDRTVTTILMLCFLCCLKDVHCLEIANYQIAELFLSCQALER